MLSVLTVFPISNLDYQHSEQTNSPQEKPRGFYQGLRCQCTVSGSCKTGYVLICISSFKSVLMTEIVTKLNDVRDDETSQNNRLDTTLADVFSLLSLFYLTIGKTRDAPATYSQIASMRVCIQSYPFYWNVFSIMFLAANTQPHE